MPQPARVIQPCVECEQDLEHCHGTAIVHCDGAGECAEDPACRLAMEQHLFAVSCAEVECGCGEEAWPAVRAAAS